jgi:hypothetical protein
MRHIKKKKGKAIPLHAMEALGRGGGIAPTHSRHLMGVSGQRHAPAALFPQGKDPRYPLYIVLSATVPTAKFYPRLSVS